MFVRDGIDVADLAASPAVYCGQPEFLILKISPSKRQSFFATIYRPPELGHLSVFRAKFERLHPSFSAAVIIGDLNTNLNYSIHDSKFLLNFSSSNHLQIVKYTDTYHTSSSHSRIDHCWLATRDSLNEKNQRAVPFLLNHNLIKVTIDLQVNRSQSCLVEF